MALRRCGLGNGQTDLEIIKQMLTRAGIEWDERIQMLTHWDVRTQALVSTPSGICIDVAGGFYGRASLTFNDDGSLEWIGPLKPGT